MKSTERFSQTAQDHLKYRPSYPAKVIQTLIKECRLMKTYSFKNTQTFDWNGFKGRLLSTSYSLRPGEKRFNEMLLELRKIYDRYENNGQIEFLYETKLYLGQLT